MKINTASSIAVSTVNGESKLPAGCGDVPVKWTDCSGQACKIVLKNVLHFPKSPVKIRNVVGLAEQLKDDWILGFYHVSINFVLLGILESSLELLFMEKLNYQNS